MTFHGNNRSSGEEGGFILILTMILISVSLAISFGIYTISIQEVVLGSYMRESERAFMAADRAIECALFWDRIHQPSAGGVQYTPFPTSTSWTATSISGSMANVTCNVGSGNVRIDGGGGTPTGWSVSGLNATQGRTTYHLNFSDGAYAEIEVFKEGIDTTITSDGYNAPPGSTRGSQRTIVARYNL